VSILFTPFAIGKMVLKNRFVHSATHEAMSNENGRVTDALVRRCRNLAKGEVGLVIPGHMFVHPLGRAHEGQTGIHDDAMIDGLAEVAEAVHEHGGKIAFQLAHGGRQAPRKLVGTAPLAPSNHGLDPVTLNRPQAMSEAQIEATITAFTDAADRAVRAGADTVQIHAAHGYLISEFLSPFFNRRQDRWGGSAENRFRLLRQIVQRIHDRHDGKLPILVKLNAQDFTPGNRGITPNLAAIYAGWLDELGVAAVEVSSGTYYSFHTIRGEIPSEEMVAALPWWMRPVARVKLSLQEKENAFQPAYNREAAEAIRPVLKKAALMLVGGMRTLPEMEAVVEQDTADLISMSRPLIREPFLVRRFREGKTESASCINCNRCFAAMFNGKPVRCYANRNEA
jgi:2,4-dienoyl-CoA reductase-like NADH-dependent reductase (Old Yellow Enzyme family)